MKTLITTLMGLIISSTAISQCPGLQSNFTTQFETCLNIGDGKVYWNTTGGSGQYNYAVFEDGTNNLIYQGATSTYTGLVSGNYYFVIEDIIASCFDTTYFQISSNPPMQVFESIQNAGCNTCNGLINVTTSGGTFPYSYTWSLNSNIVGTGSAITNLCPGLYTLEVTDANGCSETIDYTITGSGGLTGFTSPINNTIGNCDGSVSVNINGGIAPYTYTWTGPNSFTSTQQNITALCAGVYQLTATDVNGCIFTSSDTLNYAPIVSTHNQMDALCTGDMSGSIDVFPSGGSGSYNLEITDPSYNTISSSQSMFAYNLMAGSYFYIVSDLVTLDADTVSFFINEPPPIQIFQNTIDDACGQCDGSVTVNIIGGAAPYTYNWSNNLSNGPVATNLCAGTYIVDVIDINGCVATSAVTINTINPAINITGNVTPASCGLCDGEVDVTISGSSAPYTFQWDDANSQTTEDASGLCQGYYNLIVTDANGCSLGSTFNVNELNNLQITTTSTNSNCLMCDGTVDIAVTGGVLPYNYDLQNQSNSTGNFTGLCEGTQTIMVTDANGCTSYSQAFVANEVLNIPSLTISSTNESGTGANDGTASVYYDTTMHPNVIISWSPATSTQTDLYNLSQGWQLVSLVDTITGECTEMSVYVGNDQTFIYVSGTIFTDADGDCIYDTGEVTVSNQTVIVTDGVTSYTAITNNLGYYSVLVPGGTNYTVSTTLSSLQTTTCNNSVSVSGGTNNIGGINIGLSQSPVENLCIWNYNFGFVPGFSCQNPISIYNTGNVISSGIVSFIVPPMTTFDYAFPAPDNVIGDTLFWNISNLAPGAYSFIDLALLCDVSAPLGAYIETCSSIELLGGAQNLSPSCQNNCFWNDVTGSFDPNDKTASPRGEGTNGNIAVTEDEFTYTIRFQNTGTGPAVNVYITDTLTAKLDRSSLEMISASHPYNIEYYANDVIRWRFNNINLPDSGANEAASHGYISFKIKTQNTPILGETIENTANIYFDFNEPVITNTTLNTYADLAASIGKLEVNTMKVYPNPANDEISILSTIEGNKTIEIYNISGLLVLKLTNGNQLSKIDVSDFAKGMYIVKSYSELQSVHATFVKE